MTDYKKYFDNNTGLGVLATADSQGQVDAAVYARPHVLEDGTLAFIMRDRLTHDNLTSNPSAVYLFVEDGTKSKGIRLFLTKERDEKDNPMIEQIKRREYKNDNQETKFLVFFRVEKELPLVMGSST
jgi:pyridoxamine 5'-phosphate oxidase-like protein